MASTNKSWTVTGASGFDALKLADAPIPELGHKDVLVKFHGASLNYRDLIIPQGKYPFGFKDNVVPGSDGAGVVERVGDRVTRFQPGDRVILIFNQSHLAGSLDLQSRATGSGGSLDGTLRQFGAFDEQSLVRMPANLSFPEAATLTCAGLTAWNALYGLEGRKLMPGDWVLTQGTGGVSLFALQFAKAAGARVIATTSSAAKTERLKQLGADHVINYREDGKWGETAKKLTGERGGVQHVIEVSNSIKHSLDAVAIDGVVSIIGFLGGMRQQDQPSFVECLTKLATVRGLLVGSRMQFEEMNRAIEANSIKPVVDEKVFTLDTVKEAYQYMWDQKHFGKIVIEINH